MTTALTAATSTTNTLHPSSHSGWKFPNHSSSSISLTDRALRTVVVVVQACKSLPPPETGSTWRVPDVLLNCKTEVDDVGILREPV